MKKILLTILGIFIWAILSTAMSYLLFKYKLEMVFSGSFIGITATLIAIKICDLLKEKKL